MLINLFILATMMAVLLPASSLPGSSPSPTDSPAPFPSVSSPPPPSGRRIAWLGKQWFLFGANLAWHNYGGDFSGTSKGVSNPTNYNVIDARLRRAAATGMHTIRWWVFAQNHILMKDGSSAPIGINTAVYTDLDAALRLARKYDLYYVFDLFRNPEDIKNWVNDSTQRAQLAQVLGPFFAHYSGNPHILSWEIFNEPEYSIWDNSVSNGAAQDTVRQVAASIHANSTAYASTGSVELDWAGNWTGLGLDFVTPHRYLHVGNYSPWTMTASQIHAVTHSNYPLGIGEFVANSVTEGPPDALTRWEDIYNGGYIGGWPWTLWPDTTADRNYVDFGAAKTFSRMHSDLGPRQ